MLLVYRYRVKSLNGLLNRQAKAVNFVWNYCNDRQKDALRFGRRWHSSFDLNKLTTGSSKELGLHAGTINAVCEQYAKSRSAKKRPFLRYRGKKSLGWVPLKGRDLKREGDAFRFASNTFRVFNSGRCLRGSLTNAWSSRACSREFEGLSHSQVSMTSTVVAPSFEPLSPCSTYLVSIVAMHSARAVRRNRCTARFESSP